MRERICREGLTEGIVCVLSALEPCRSYLLAQSSVYAGTPLGTLTDKHALPLVSRGHRSRGLNTLAGIDADVVEVLRDGEFPIRGSRKREVLDLLFGITNEPVERCRRLGRVI